MKNLFYCLSLAVSFTNCKPLQIDSYATPQVREKFLRVNDSTYFNQYKNIFLIKRADGRWYPCK